MKILAAIFLLSAISFSQTDLSSASAGDAVPTNTSKAEQLQANANPLVVRNATKIAAVNLTPTEFLDKFAVWKRASEVRGASPTHAFSSVVINPSVPGVKPVQNENDAEVASFLIAYKVSAELNLKFKDVIMARKTAPSLTDALKVTALKENKADLVPQLQEKIAAMMAEIQ